MAFIDINCDMGEGIGNEEWLMPYIQSANIACGYHAGNEETMKHIVGLCTKYNVKIGAHPSFSDRKNFGRTEIHLPAAEVEALVFEQVALLGKIAAESGTTLYHVKPHGALYNMAAKDPVLAKAIVQAVLQFDRSLVLYGLSGSVLITEAKNAGLQVANEVFADRRYQDDGSLTPRTMPNALITNTEQMVQQAVLFANENKVVTANGKTIHLQADTICIHGDGEHAVEFARELYKLLGIPKQKD